ncbi:hypothetical protein M409DRAFT_19893 [Zasmidium cellare ATCC 36951]|uniref:Fe2OG dioxygenase domain-containing protein n=1 Tax=Zasmidium cellare ATCC 36951 TaxID=1080233 RepID=A0A6A6CT70_ZASCE|nr:uncharacterized protein M409DRAFT_19893 [Zasmidium cellare ATCC 36951]KAF2170291.1 hypothetical protein M409DRAFT_19893 [Zasmidium cellare ATCC 36951]
MTTVKTTTYNEAWNGAKQYLTQRLGSTQGQGQDADFGIPIIDIGPSYSSNLGDRKQVAEQIRKACVTSGFFYITNHGIDKQACQGIIRQGQRLFKELSREQKEAISLKKSPYGYGWEDATSTSLQNDVEESKEGFNWSYEEDLDPAGGDGGYVQIDGSTATHVNQWPSEKDLPGFYDGIKHYYGPALQLARHLCKLFAISLSLPEDYFGPMITHPSGNSRFMYYPPSKNPGPLNDSSASGEIGLGAHSDYQVFTILLCSSTPGLEILSPSGRWITAPTVENGIIVNIGDMMMRWTNDIYKSTVHRVVNRTAAARYSMPLFFGINNDQIVETLPSCVSETNPSKYGPIKAGEYVLQRLATTRNY